MNSGGGDLIKTMGIGKKSTNWVEYVPLVVRREHPDWTVVGGVISPTHDSYQKASLIPASHRLEMARRATLCSDWIRVSDWETRCGPEGGFLSWVKTG